MTREEAINELEALKQDYWDDDGYGHETKQYDDTMTALDMAIEALNQKWIPVTERLPEESDDYLVTNDDDVVEMAYFAHPKDYAISKGEWREIWYEDDVIAWMPLPKPYKRGQEVR